MNRIDRRFAELKRRGETALVGFVLCGDPSPSRSRELLGAMCRAGLDILELGVPFSDPTADGPVIQRGASRALRQGTTLSTAIETARDLRNETDIPIVIFSYYNPLIAYGPAPFFRDARSAGADGVLVVDLPREESAELTDHLEDPGGFAFIRLVAPTTPPERMRRLVDGASGFLYLIATTGVTGGGNLDRKGIGAQAAALRALTDLPLCAGFGISTPDNAAALAPSVDGVVVGSAFVRTIEAYENDPGLAQRLEEQVRSFREVLRDRG